MVEALAHEPLPPYIAGFLAEPANPTSFDFLGAETMVQTSTLGAPTRI